MAQPKGPLGNAPRDLRDDFVGELAEDLKAGTPPRWPPNPKKVTKNDFHAKVSGGNAASRADRSPHYRRGGFVSARAEGGAVKTSSDIKPKEMTPKSTFSPERMKEIETQTRQMRQNAPFKSGGVAKRADGGVLSAGQRQSLPRSDFALPGKGKGPKGAGSGSYPIPDESHARNALARVSQHGSSAEKAEVRAKVKAKYPGIGQK